MTPTSSLDRRNFRATSKRSALMQPERLDQRCTATLANPLAALPVVALTCGIGFLCTAVDASDFLRQGNDAFEAGEFAAAIESYEAATPSNDLLTRRFNAGVSWLRQGDRSKATERFEDVATRARGELQQAAHYNLGWTHFGDGKAAFEEASEMDSTADFDATVKKLAEAAKSLRSSISFFRKVEPSTEASDFNLGVAKTALKSVLDRIAKLEEEKREREEDEALKSPPQLIRRLIAAERQHRALGRGLEDAPPRRRRIPSRQLRKAEEANRALAEKLAHRLKVELEEASKAANSASTPAPAGGTTPPPPPPESPAPEQLQAAAKTLAEAIEAMKNAEADYAELAIEKAVGRHTEAIRSLRQTLLAFPVHLPEIIAEGIAFEEAILESTRQILGENEETAGSASGDGSAPPKGDGDEKSGDAAIDSSTSLADQALGAGKALLGALKDKVLQPIARHLNPHTKTLARTLADDQEEVIWAAALISRAEVPPTPAAATSGGAPLGHPGGNHPDPHGAPTAGLDEAAAKELSEKLRAAGAEALTAATEALDALRSARLDAARVAEERALEALRQAEDLLPKPPKSLEERLRDLLVRQTEAETSAAGIQDLAGEPKEAASAALGASQRSDGAEAGKIAAELKERQDERAQKALPKMTEGEQAVFASAEALDRGLTQEAGEAIERDIAAFHEALAILSGQDQNQDGQDPNEQQQNQDQRSQEPQDQRQEQQNLQQVNVSQAREERERMDQERREQEAKIFSGSSGRTAVKDW